MEGFRDSGRLRIFPDAKHLYFPIHDKSGNFKKPPLKDMRLPNGLHEWLRSIQPCYALEFTNNPDAEAIREAVVVINQCSILDRHKHLHVIGAYLLDSTATIEADAPAVITYSHTVPADLFKGEEVTAYFGIEGLTEATKIRGGVDSNCM